MKTKHTPLDEVRKTLRVSWYRCPVPDNKLRELSRPSNIQGWVQSLGHLAMGGCTGVITYSFFLQQNWIGFVVALFIHGAFWSFMGSANHELGHGTVFKTKWLNRAFLWIYSVLSYHNHRNYAMSHTYHHRYTLHPEGDREVELPKNPSLKILLVLQKLTFNVVGGLEAGGMINHMKTLFSTALARFPGQREWIEALYEDCPEERMKAINCARITIFFHVVVLVIAISFKLWLLPILITLAPFIGNIWRYMVGVPMHCGLRDNVPDFRLCVRSMTLDPLSSFLYWRMNWHTEHHMYASVPCYRLAELYHEIADDMPKPRTLVGAWREMREIWRRQQVDPSYQFDTPLPESAGRLVTEQQDTLSASIGDLAPEVLAEEEGNAAG